MTNAIWRTTIKMNAPVPQSKPLPGRESEMVENKAGGYSFKSFNWTMLNRFLCLGTNGGTFYEGEFDVTKANMDALDNCLQDNPAGVLALIAKVNADNSAFKRDVLLYALARTIDYLVTNVNQAHADYHKHFEATGSASFNTFQPTLKRIADFERLISQAHDTALSVFRTASELFGFLSYGRSLFHYNPASRSARTMIDNFFNREDIVWQALKYRNRSGWSYGDVLRLAHIKPRTARNNALYKWMVGKAETVEGEAKIDSFNQIQIAENLNDVLTLIKENNFSWEFVPDRWKSEKAVWEQLITTMPYNALVRQLGKLTNVGVFDGEWNKNVNYVADRLSNKAEMAKANVHPLTMFIAAMTYKNGKGEKGVISWKANSRILDALWAGFENSFAVAPKSDKRIMYAVDNSGSMTNHYVSGGINSREAGVAAAWIAKRMNPEGVEVYDYSDDIRRVNLSEKMSYEQALAQFRKTGNSTDCALPITYAIQHNLEVDGIVSITDSYSWYGNTHVSQALAGLRKNRSVKYVGVQTSASGTQLIDPNDTDSIEIAGFSPKLMEVATKMIEGVI